MTLYLYQHAHSLRFTLTPFGWPVQPFGAWRAGETSELTAGGVFFIPAGVEHTFIVVERARWIATLSPGGLESFFPAAAAQGLEIPRDLAKIKTLAAQYDMEITGPPLKLAAQ